MILTVRRYVHGISISSFIQHLVFEELYVPGTALILRLKHNAPRSV